MVSKSRGKLYLHEAENQRGERQTPPFPLNRIGVIQGKNGAEKHTGPGEDPDEKRNKPGATSTRREGGP